MIKKIIILKGSREILEPESNVVVLSNEELRNRLMQGGAFSFLFRFSEATVLTYGSTP